ncbi:MAG: hypothetical protein ABTQ31_17605 [Rhizobiaceae bacterium]
MHLHPQVVPSNTVNLHVTEGYGEWFVHNVSDGGDTVVSFEVEAEARSFAAIRLSWLRGKTR